MNPWIKKNPTGLLNRLMELVWLLTIASLPTLFIPTANEPFVLPKIHLLYTLGLFLLLCWLTKGLSGGITIHAIKTYWKQFDSLQKLFLGSVALLFGVCFLSTLQSSNLRTSIFGSYHRGNGLLVFGIFVLLFVTLFTHIRTRAQVHRILNMMMGTGAIVALYSIMQWQSVDPIRWATDAAFRPPSTLGNPVFSGAFLMLCLPVGMYLFYSTKGILRWMWIGLTSLILVAFYISYSRAPLVGLLVAVPFLALLVAHFRQSSFMKRSVIGGCLGLIVFLLVVNLWDSPNNAIRKTPGISRMTNFLDQTRTGQSTAVRILLWDASIRMFKEQPGVLLLGAGPDQLNTVIAPYLSPELNYRGYRNILPDRLHNAFLDHLATLGIAGGLLHLFSCWLLLFLGMRKTGFFQETRSFLRYTYWTLVVACLLSALVIILDGTLRFAGLAFPLGLFLGAGAFVAFAPVHSASSNKKSTLSLLYGILATLVMAHIVEIQFGFGVLSTLLILWVCAGIILSPQKLDEKEPLAPVWPYLLVPLVWFLFSIVSGLLPPSPAPYYTAIFIPLVLSALFLFSVLPSPEFKEPESSRSFPKHRYMLITGIAIVVLVVATRFLDHSVKADIIFREARQNDKVGSPASYQPALRLSHERPAYFLDAARYALGRGQTTSGRALLEKYAFQFPDNPYSASAQGLAALGLAQTQPQDPSATDHHAEQALHYTRKALDQWPANPILWNQLFDAQVLTGDNAAKATIQNSLKRDSLFFETHLRMARLARTQENWKEAAQHYEIALFQGGNTPAAHSALGFVYAHMGRFSEAILQNQEVLKQKPGDVQSHQNIIILKATQGDCSGAKNHFDQVIPYFEKDRISLIQLQLSTLCNEEDF